MKKQIKIKQKDLEIDLDKIKDITSVEVINNNLILNLEMKE